MAQCPTCGTEVSEQAAFCPDCGTDLKPAAATTPPAAPASASEAASAPPAILPGAEPSSVEAPVLENPATPSVSFSEEAGRGTGAGVVPPPPAAPEPLPIPETPSIPEAPAASGAAAASAAPPAPSAPPAAPAGAAGGAWITLKRSGSLTSETFPLGERVTVGRFDLESGPVDVDLAALPEASYVSRHHVEIWRDGSGQWFVKDLQSRNGTFVRTAGQGQFQRATGDTPVHDGDEIALGNARFEFRSG